MRAAVTGAGGYVGTNLLQRLADDGHDVVAVDRVRSDVAGEAVVWRQADVLDRQGVRAVIEGSDIVFHLAGKITLAPHDEEAWTVNTQGVRIAAEAALDAGVRRIVHCSSVHSFDQYGCGGRIDESTERSVDPSIPVYDRSKWAGEQELHTVIANGLDAVICNPTGIYGPVDHGLSRGNAVLRQVARGRFPFNIEGGFDWVDVRDVASGLVAAADRGRKGENYLLNGHFLTNREFFRRAAGFVGRRGPRVTLPLGVVKAALPVIEPVGRRFRSDIISRGSLAAIECAPRVDGAKARDELGYAARPVEESMRDLMAFFVSSGWLDRRRQ